MTEQESVVSLRRALLTIAEGIQSLLLYSEYPWSHKSAAKDLEKMINDLYSGRLEPYDYNGDTD
jgi:hypothetical protein